MGKSFDITSSVSRQLPFFSCINSIINKEYQKDISKYIYCKRFNIPPFKGSYEEQSFKWITKSNIIELALNKRNQDIYNKQDKNK
tara:strand:- start:201 stop:455 length:255 start_codon:yes stop_codon:yes gene_type:complete